MTSIKEVNNQELWLEIDRLGNWILEDSQGNELFNQSESDIKMWADRLIIETSDDTDKWISLYEYMDDNGLVKGIPYKVRCTDSDWGCAIGIY